MLIQTVQAVLVFSLLLVRALPTPTGGKSGPANPSRNPSSISPSLASNAHAALTPKQPVHPASLIAASAHNAALLKFLETDLSQNLISHFCSMVVQRVTKERNAKELSDLSLWAGRFLNSEPKLFTNTAVVMVALAYLERAKLPSHFSDKDPLKSVLLGAVILASKSTRDEIRADGWAYPASGTFEEIVAQIFKRIQNLFTGEKAKWAGRALWTSEDILVVERHFLGYLNYDLKIDEAMLRKIFDALPEDCKRPASHT